MTICRAQVVTEEAHLATEGRKQEAMAKCMAASVLEVPLPAPAAVPDEEIDTDGNAVPASGRRGRSKKAHRFLLPVPVQMPAEQDEQMQGDDDAKPSSRCEPCCLNLLDPFPLFLCYTVCILVRERCTCWSTTCACYSHITMFLRVQGEKSSTGEAYGIVRQGYQEEGCSGKVQRWLFAKASAEV